MEKSVLVIGAGLAGSEAAWFLANHGVKVKLVECKTVVKNPSQRVETFAELVCTNSLKSKEVASAHGILKREMQGLGSIIISSAYENAVPAGMALAVDRDAFSSTVTEKLKNHENIEIILDEVKDPVGALKQYSCDYCVVATGPLTSSNLATWIKETVSHENLYFYDAIAPVVDADSLDMSKLYFKDRHEDVSEDHEPDYLNAALNKEQYEALMLELVNAKKVPSKDFENFKFFESCLPIDTMAERGIDTARFSCMKPLGLEVDGKEPYAAVQLRRENLLGSAYNLVGFQNKLTYSEQKRVFRMIPGFEEAEFVHLGSVHRNTYIHSKELCFKDFSLKENRNIYFAGQISGVEGYTESASMGLYVAVQILERIRGNEIVEFPVETAMGAIVNYVFTGSKPVPSNINFGLMPAIVLTKEQRRLRHERKKIKKELAAERAFKAFHDFMEKHDWSK